MARTARPWYAADKPTYRAYVNGRRVTLLRGEENPTNARLAEKKLRQVVKGSVNDAPPARSGSPTSSTATSKATSSGALNRPRANPARR